MNVLKTLSYIVLASIAAAVVTATPASAQVGAWTSYAAKFVCKAMNDKDDIAVLGKYRTVVNIHNPHNLVDPTGEPVPLVFFKKVVRTFPQGEDPLQPSCKQFEALRSDEGLSVDCDNIKDLLRISGLPITGILDGFVVIEVPPQTPNEMAPPLDVVAVYTARQRTGTDPDSRRYDVSTMDVERVSATTIIGIPEDHPCPPD